LVVGTHSGEPVSLRCITPLGWGCVGCIPASHLPRYNVTHVFVTVMAVVMFVFVQHTTALCNTLQHTAAHCNQHTAAHCSTLQHTATHYKVVTVVMSAF